MYERIKKSIDFIEINLTEHISLNEVASKAFCSLSYFHNAFRIMTGIALKEYIRNRRLVSSDYELVNTDGMIIDLAYRYQYETPESFTRAFTKMFGVTPSVYRKNNKHAIVFQKIDILQMSLKILQEGYFMDPKIIDMEEIKIIGIELRTSCDDSEFSMGIKELWSR
ncbi:AraC family transcriptional regulator [Clostridium sp. UBA7503]|uniref:AraC family transcriptional regulator n=1 Tax=Clostridium sp. UBA7503 TaxID=1946377 RepID=UPI003216F4BB